MLTSYKEENNIIQCGVNGELIYSVRHVGIHKSVDLNKKGKEAM